MKKTFNKSKYINRNKHNIIVYDLILIGLFMLLNFILYLINVRFRLWFLITVSLIFLIGFIIGIIQLALKSSKIVKIVIAYLSCLVVILCLCFWKVIFFFLAFSFCSEHTTILDDKKYVAVVKSFLRVDVSYYDYYGPFLMGTKERVHGDFGKGGYDPFDSPTLPSNVEYTYYDDNGKTIKITRKNFEKDENGKITNTINYDIYNKETDSNKTNESDNYLLPEDEEVLYEKKFGNTILRFGKVDYVLGQNMLVNVVKSSDSGENFHVVSGEVIQVSNEAKFIFLDESLGFAISTGKIYLDNSKASLYVTNDGGKSFKSATFKYQNKNVNFIGIEGLPYYSDDKLKLNASVYQINSNKNGYENKELIFISKDKGLNWTLEK